MDPNDIVIVGRPLHQLCDIAYSGRRFNAFIFPHSFLRQ
jgi:hypothetical protein